MLGAAAAPAKGCAPHRRLADYDRSVPAGPRRTSALDSDSRSRCNDAPSPPHYPPSLLHFATYPCNPHLRRLQPKKINATRIGVGAVCWEGELFLATYLGEWVGESVRARKMRAVAGCIN